MFDKVSLITDRTARANLIAVTTSGAPAAGQVALFSGATAVGGVPIGSSLTTVGSTLDVASHILLNTLTASSSATLADTTSLTGSYSVYEIEFINIVPATNATTLQFQVHSGGAFKTTGYIGSNTLVGAAMVITNPTTFVQLSGSTSVQNSGAGFWGFCVSTIPQALPCKSQCMVRVPASMRRHSM
jgi:hypothetical protein